MGAVAEFNEELAQGNPLPVSEQMSLLPGPGGLDSLGFVNLVTLIETHLQKCLGLLLPLVEAADVDGDLDPWQSLGALADFIVSRAGATDNETR